MTACARCASFDTTRLHRRVGYRGVRVGEADNPGHGGPERNERRKRMATRVALHNPTSMEHASDMMADEVADIYVFSEANMPDEGADGYESALGKQRKWINWSGPGPKVIRGNTGMYGRLRYAAVVGDKIPLGKQDWPWNKAVWNTGRVVEAVAEVACGIQLGIYGWYGYSGGSTEDKHMSETLLDNVFDMALLHEGPAVICADTNLADNDCLTMSRMREAGWVDAEVLMATKQEREPRCTSYASEEAPTRIDTIWVNQLAALALTDVVTMPVTYGPVHCPVIASFAWKPITQHVYRWRKPLPMIIPDSKGGKRWTVDGLVTEYQKGNCEEEEERCRAEAVARDLSRLQSEADAFANECPMVAMDWFNRNAENLLLAALPSDDATSVGRKRGRGSQNEPVKQRQFQTRPKPGRQGEDEITRSGTTVVARMRTKQLRRLQDIRRQLASERKTSLSRTAYIEKAWSAVVNAPGYGGSFCEWLTVHHQLHLEGFDIFNIDEHTWDLLSSIIDAVEKDRVKVAENELRTRISKAREKKLESLKGDKKECWKALRKLPSPQTCLLSIDGRWSSDVDSMDRALRKKWVDGIFNKHVGVGEERWDNFRALVDQYISDVGPAPDMDVTAEQLHETISGMNNSATGDDGWAVKELKALPAFMFKPVASALNQVKRGAAWPMQLLTATVACARKKEDAKEVDDLRLLSVYVVLIRAHGSIIAKRFLRWLSSFGPKGQLGGMPGEEVSDIFVELSVWVEHAHTVGQHIAGFTTDEAKAFDCAPWSPLAYIQERLGVDGGYIDAERRFLAESTRRFSIAGGLGQGWQACTGFPQGLPESVHRMILLNLIWHKIIDTKFPSFTTYSWADNLQAVSPEGNDKDVLACYRQTEVFAETLDLKLKKDGTWLWATCNHTRSRMRSICNQPRFFRGEGKDKYPLCVASSARELGAHLNYANTNRNATLKQRVSDAKAALAKLRRMPGSWMDRQIFVKQGTNAKALWGAVATPVGQSVIDGLRTATVRAQRPKGDHRRKRRSVDLAITLPSIGAVDPELYLLQHRLLGVRRWLIRTNDDGRDRAVSILQKGGGQQAGAISLLLKSAQKVGWKIYGNFEVSRAGVSMSLVGTDKTAWIQVATRDWYQKAWRQAKTKRKVWAHSQKCLDFDAAKLAIHKLNGRDSGRIRCVQTDALPMKKDLQKWGYRDDDQCACGAVERDLRHRVFDCPLLAHVRNKSEHADVVRRYNSFTDAGRANTMFTSVLPTQSAAEEEARSALHAIRVAPIDTSVLPDGEELHVFLDGSLRRPAKPRWRLGGSGAWVQNCNYSWFSALPGEAQTITRAELLAVVQWVSHTDNMPLALYIDNAHVKTQAERIWNQGSISRSELSGMLNSDLWQAVGEAKRRFGGKVVSFHKVKAHKDEPTAGTEEWRLWRGNDLADAAAAKGVACHDIAKWQRLEKDHLIRVKEAQQMARLVVDIQSEIYEAKVWGESQREDDEQEGVDIAQDGVCRRLEKARTATCGKEPVTWGDDWPTCWAPPLSASALPSAGSNDHVGPARDTALASVNSCEAKVLNYGKKFMKRLVKWMYSLEWKAAPHVQRTTGESVSFAVLAACFVLETGTEFPVPYDLTRKKESKGRSTWVLVDEVKEACLVTRSLRQMGQCLHNALGILHKIGAMYELPKRGYSMDVATYGCRSEAHGLLARPRLVGLGRAEHVLRSYFFAGKGLGLNAVWKRSQHGAPVCDVADDEEVTIHYDIWKPGDHGKFKGYKVTVANRKADSGIHLPFELDLLVRKARDEMTSQIVCSKTGGQEELTSVGYDKDMFDKLNVRARRTRVLTRDEQEKLKTCLTLKDCFSARNRLAAARGLHAAGFLGPKSFCLYCTASSARVTKLHSEECLGGPLAATGSLPLDVPDVALVGCRKKVEERRIRFLAWVPPGHLDTCIACRDGGASLVKHTAACRQLGRDFDAWERDSGVVGARDTSRLGRRASARNLD
eukprot:TRINITY_DN11740_c1_g2_i2.p1 TRINITY_DN11740_c1_g2~~TRINITY_DN11740_c1_g2_i2.p1  ORF type:complete len:1975 (-),score=190.27 TRINITY_DN11740_c1_g2_i2:196-6120(-)